MPDTHVFGTVLVKRRTNAHPKDWELQLRPICRKIRVVENLLGGAHLMVTGSPSVAVRIYNSDDASRFEDTSSKANTDSPDLEIEGLAHFRDTYEHSIVIFVLPTGQIQRDQLGRRESFLNVAQRALLLDRMEDGNDHGKKHTSRTAIVCDISQVLRTIDSVAKSLLSEKCKKRKLYFAQVASQHFLQGEGTQQLQEVIANHATTAFVAWAERFGMPTGDSTVALSVLGSLAKVTTANRTVLNEVPIRNASKELISFFFGSEKADRRSLEVNFPIVMNDSDISNCPEHLHDVTYPPPECNILLQAFTNPSHAQSHQSLERGYSPNRLHCAGTPASGAIHRDQFSGLSFQNGKGHGMRNTQYTHQGFGGYSYPSHSAAFRTNPFL